MTGSVLTGLRLCRHPGGKAGPFRQPLLFHEAAPPKIAREGHPPIRTGSSSDRVRTNNRTLPGGGDPVVTAPGFDFVETWNSRLPKSVFEVMPGLNKTPEANKPALSVDNQTATTDTQRRKVVSHPRLVMKSLVWKKLGIAAFLLFTFLVLGSVTGLTAAAERIADKIAGRLVFYVHIAQLYSKEPDKKIAMPVKDVSKNHVTNTWQAARGTDRLHEGQDIFAPQGTPVLSATEGYIANIGQNNLGGQTVSVVGAGGRTY